MLFEEKLDVLFKKECPLIGHVTEFTYENVSIMTHDFNVSNAHYIPQHTLLLIKIENPQRNDNQNIEINSVILCRVNSISYIDNFSKENKQASIQKFERKISSVEEQKKSNDILTQNKLSYFQLNCKILGTFYYNHNNDITFGSDAFTFSVANIYSVYKPTGETLSKIVNFINKQQLNNNIALLKDMKATIDFQEDDYQQAIDTLSFDLGHVRYASTNLEAPEERTPIKVMATDFIKQKTALFGMTRTGKSNTVKVIIEGIQHLSANHNLKIGQLIYDINGEYANDNKQNKKIANSINYTIDKEILLNSLAQVADKTTKEKIIQQEFHGALNNFYINPEYALNIIKYEFNKNSQQANYVNVFLSIEATDILQNTLTYLLWCLLLYKSGYKLHTSNPILKSYFLAYIENKQNIIALPINKGILPDSLKGFFTLNTINKHQYYCFTEKQLNNIINQLSDNRLSLTLTEKQKSLKAFIIRKSEDSSYTISGWQMLTPFIVYHSEYINRTDYRADIYSFIKEGKTVILDLSIGEPNVRQFISNELMDYIFKQQIQIFRKNESCPIINVFIEEAHNLIGKNAPIDSLWPRIAKEGAKYNLGLLYATQEPSAIHNSILANTANFVISHLNNRFEINTISEYEDFYDFAQSIKNSNDVGFIKLKLLSKLFTMSVQVKKYE